MEYLWEKKITNAMMNEFSEILPKGYKLRAIAVEKVSVAEAALITCADNQPPNNHGIGHCDVWQDILGDAKRHYSDAVNHMRQVFEDTLNRKISDDEFGGLLTQFALEMPKKPRNTPRTALKGISYDDNNNGA